MGADPDNLKEADQNCFNFEKIVGDMAGKST